MTHPTARQKADALARVETLDLTPYGRADLIKKIKSGEFFKVDPRLVSFDRELPMDPKVGA